MVWQSFACAQLFETVELYHESPPGTILALQASLGIACLFLPRDEAHAMWARRKLATIESHGLAAFHLPQSYPMFSYTHLRIQYFSPNLGRLLLIPVNRYIYPYTFRTKMSDLFRDRSCMQWWLPNNERYPPIIRSIRKFVEERTAPAVDVPTEDLKDMKTIFASRKFYQKSIYLFFVVARCDVVRV